MKIIIATVICALLSPVFVVSFIASLIWSVSVSGWAVGQYVVDFLYGE